MASEAGSRERHLHGYEDWTRRWTETRTAERSDRDSGSWCGHRWTWIHRRGARRARRQV